LVLSVWRTREKFGESRWCSLNSERLLENFWPLTPRIPADSSKVLLFSEECSNMDFFLKPKESSITSSVWPSTNSWKEDYRLESSSSILLTPFTTLVSLLDKDTSGKRERYIYRLYINFKAYYNSISSLMP